MQPMNAVHENTMRAALGLAKRNLGQTWPNPAVGAIIVKDSAIVGEGYTARGGRPHAETQAIEQAGNNAEGATLYVTLEPCAHQGKTPPCTDAIIQSGITRVVIACSDLNPLVSGKGIAQLRNAGIEVIENVCMQEACEINRGFFSTVTRNRPLISLKLATTLDGKIATSTGESQWITSQAAREYTHMLRSQYDAVATGIGTVLADNPQLTCRLPGLEDKSPVRIVFDSSSRMPASCQLVQTAGSVPVWHLSLGHENQKPLKSPGISAFTVSGQNRIDLAEAVKLIKDQGITRLLVEAGKDLSTAFLQSGLVDRMYWFRAPLIIGNEGLPAFGNGFSPALAQLQRWQVTDHIALPPDSLDILECSPAL